MDFEHFLRVFAAFRRERVEYVLAGPYANAVRGRMDGDERIDLFVDSTALNLFRLHHALHSVWSNIDFRAICGTGTAFQCLLPTTPLFLVIETQPIHAIPFEEYVVNNVPILVAFPRFRRLPIFVKSTAFFTQGERLRAISSLAEHLNGPRRSQRGVRKYGSWAALQADRALQEDERVARIRVERLRK